LIHKNQVFYITILKYIKESIKDKKKSYFISYKKLIHDFEIFYCDHS